MNEITLKLTVDDANRILISLSKMPYEYVNVLIGKVHKSVSEQLQQSPSPV